MELILASGNKHKAEEFVDLFDQKNIQIKASTCTIDVVEDGGNYYENALKKAQTYYKKFQVPVMSDDSGLDVYVLPGELGIYSARFGGESLNFDQRIKLLLEKMNTYAGDQRKAAFTCVLCFYLNDDEVYYFEGKVKGMIDQKPRGKKGFGYDPVFIPEGLKKENKTFAMVPEWKKLNSHRFKACQKASEFFSSN